MAELLGRLLLAVLDEVSAELAPRALLAPVTVALSVPGHGLGVVGAVLAVRALGHCHSSARFASFCCLREVAEQDGNIHENSSNVKDLRLTMK